MEENNQTPTSNHVFDYQLVGSDDEQLEINRSLYYLGKALYRFSNLQQQEDNCG